MVVTWHRDRIQDRQMLWKQWSAIGPLYLVRIDWVLAGLQPELQGAFSHLTLRFSSSLLAGWATNTAHHTSKWILQAQVIDNIEHMIQSQSIAA